MRTSSETSFLFFLSNICYIPSFVETSSAYTVCQENEEIDAQKYEFNVYLGFPYVQHGTGQIRQMSHSQMQLNIILLKLFFYCGIQEFPYVQTVSQVCWLYNANYLLIIIKETKFVRSDQIRLHLFIHYIKFPLFRFRLSD